jgi:hypothetical protein
MRCAARPTSPNRDGDADVTSATKASAVAAAAASARADAAAIKGWPPATSTIAASTRPASFPRMSPSTPVCA